MTRVIATIGYEGATIDAFIRALKREDIDTIIDVRAIPFSRKPGFSKTPLSVALSDAGISYMHFRHMGNPEKGKNIAHEKGWSYEAMYQTHLKTPNAIAELNIAAQMAKDSRICLLCFERDPATCHRRFTAIALRELTGLKVRDVYVEEQVMADLFG